MVLSYFAVSSWLGWNPDSAQAFRLPSMGAIHRRSWIHDGVSRLKTSGTRAWMELSFQCLAPIFLKISHRCKWASFPVIVIAQVALIFWGATATMRLWASHPIMRNWYNMLQPSPTKDYRWSFGNWWFPLVEPGSSCKHPRAMYKNCSVAGAAHSFAQFDGMLHGWKQIPVGLLDSHGVSSVSTEWRQHPCLPTLWVLVRVWFVKSQYKKYFTHARMDQGGAGPASNARKHRKVHVMHAGTNGRCWNIALSCRSPISLTRLKVSRHLVDRWQIVSGREQTPTTGVDINMGIASQEGRR